LIYNEVAPRVKATVKGLVNTGVLSTVAARLNRGVPATMPAGVVLSIRGVRATTRGTESVIGVRGALAAFGGVLNKLPALSGGAGRCFIASAALHPEAQEVQVLRLWRDERLLIRPGGARLIGAYERISAPLAVFIARSDRRRALVRRLVVAPAARVARWSLRK
jgi:hypothetical protein